MTQKQSEKSPFKSSYGGGFLSAHQWLAEQMCARLARAQGKDLYPFFWKKEEWKRMFLMQVRYAAGLLLLYDMRVIISVLKANPKIYSLGFKGLDPAFQAAQKKFETQLEAAKQNPPKKEEVSATPPEPSKPRDVYTSGKSILGKLRDLDG